MHANACARWATKVEIARWTIHARKRTAVRAPGMESARQTLSAMVDDTVFANRDGTANFAKAAASAHAPLQMTASSVVEKTEVHV
jgi:hypothetical protein